MNSPGEKTEFSCPFCGQLNNRAGQSQSPERGPVICSKCSREIPPDSRLGTESAVHSPFDDLFDHQGEPNWSEEQEAEEFLAAEALNFPDNFDPLDLQPAQTLTPLESEAPEHFEFVQGPAAEVLSRELPGKPEQAAPADGSGAIPLAGEPVSDRANPDDQTPPAEDLELEPIDAVTEPREFPTGSPPTSPIFSTGHTLTDDADQPLKIEGLEDAGPADSMVGVRCRVCDTLIYVQEDQLGQKVKCPECYSEVLAEQTAPRKTTPAGFPQQPLDHVVWTIEPSATNSSREAEDEYRLSEPVERPHVDIPSHYGLDATSSDLLAPVSKERPPNQRATKTETPSPTSAPKSEVSGARSPEPDVSPGPLSQDAGREKKNIQGEDRPREKLQEMPQADSVGKREKTPSGLPLEPATSAATERQRPAQNPYWQEQPVRPEAGTESADQDSGEEVFDLEFDDLAAPGPALLGWLRAVVRDGLLLILAGLAILCAGLGYWVMGAAGNWLASSEAKSFAVAAGAMLLGLPGFVALLLGFGLTALIAAILFQLGTQRKVKFSSWLVSPEQDWLSAVGFVAFAFWIAVLPGALAGILLAIVSGMVFWIPALGALSGCLLAPIFLASVCRGDSAFGIFESGVLKQIQFEDVDWLKFLPGSLISFGVFLLGTLFLLIPGIVGSLLGSMGQAAGWILFGSLTGLYCGLLVEKVNSKEAVK